MRARLLTITGLIQQCHSSSLKSHLRIIGLVCVRGAQKVNARQSTINIKVVHLHMHALAIKSIQVGGAAYANQCFYLLHGLRM